MDLISDGVEKITSMKSREIERKLNLQKKQETKKSVMAENEQLDFFENTFNEKHRFIDSLIRKSPMLPKDELPEHFNLISKEILLLQKYVAASNLFIHNYLLQKCQNTIQELSNASTDLENQLLPKKKFSFRNKSKVNIERPNSVDLVDFGRKGLNGGPCEKQKSIPIIECGFYNKSDEVLRLDKNKLFKQDVSLEQLTNCKVYLEGMPSTLHLNYLKDCQIFSGPVSTSIFAENCHNCTFIIACQQLRLHASKHINIYLHVTSRAIMEDCFDIAIAPYNWTYPNINKDFVEAGLNKQVNNWRNIDDFNWLNAERHSPHWREMEEEMRVEEWI